MFEVYHRTQAYNLTERENLKNSDSPFPYLFEDFRFWLRYNNVTYGAWHVYKPYFGSSVATCSLSMNAKKA